MAQIQVLFQARGEVMVAAQMLSDAAGRPQNRERDPELYQKFQRKIWAVEDSDDELTAKINAAVDKIVAVCSPHLR